VDLPGSGLAVWHVDETQANNTNPIAYKVALVQADGKRDLEMNRNQGDAGDLFPGSRNVTSLGSTRATHPHTRDNSGAATRVALSTISMTNGIVNLKVKI
jgi:immune inhibitor A